MQCLPLQLSAQRVALETLTPAHLDEITAAAADGELWKLFFTSVPAPQHCAQWLSSALTAMTEQRALPFAIRDLGTGKIVGSTRFFNLVREHRRLEIGHTWLARSAQRSGINTEMKLLMLRHAFQAWDCLAVELRTDFFNRRSQAAIERLGAKRDGILRNHMVMPDGRIRDTVVYSILQNEWAGVEQNLQYLLDRRA